MLEPLLFALGVLNSVSLTLIFIFRGKRLDLVQRFGWLYFLLAIPAIVALVLVRQEEKDGQYAVFLAIFLAFLAIEALYDWILRIPFRERPDWRLLTPYVALYLSSNYGFVVMTWKEWSVAGGVLLLVLFVVQILANLRTHPSPETPE